MKKIIMVLLPFMTIGTTEALTPLSDESLANTTAQALLGISSQTLNGIGFDRISLNATMDLNLNARQIQLGCGGANGASGCDIDLDYVALSGQADTSTGRVGSDATITNPFIEVAFKNPNNKSTRELIGINLGAEYAKGQLTIGQENSTVSNGINSLSGFIKVQSFADRNTLEGVIDTAPAYMDISEDKYPLNGRLTALPITVPNPAWLLDPFGIFGTKRTIEVKGAVASYRSISGGFWIPGMQGIRFQTDGTVINGNRQTGIAVNPIVTLPELVLGHNQDLGTCGALANQPCNTHGYTSGFPTAATATDAPSTQRVNYNAAGNISNDILTKGGPGTVLITDCKLLNAIEACGLLGINNDESKITADFYGRVQGLKADVTFNQPLGLIHKLNINSPLSLSVQKEKLIWPNAPTYLNQFNNVVKVEAQRGWWLSANDPIYLGSLVPSNPVSLCTVANDPSRCVFPQIAEQFSTILSDEDTMPRSSDLSAVAFPDIGTNRKHLGVQVGRVNLSPLSLIIDGVQLASQNFSPNCYGGKKFC